MDGYDGKDLQDGDRQWSFSGALLYSVTVITTIGYGNLSPKTSEGKVVTMLYALVGVPLMLLCLSNLGSLLAGTFQFAYSHARCEACERQQQQEEQQQQQQVEQQQKAESRQAESRRAVPVPVPVPAPAPLTCTINPRARGRPRPPLGPEVRALLAECAEYSRAQEVLRELRARGEGEPEPEDADVEPSVPTHDTPSRVPLIWRPPDDQHVQKRPPTPPPRRPKPDVTEPAAGAAGPACPRRRRREARVPVYIVLLVLVLYICLGAAVFAAWEEWSFLDGAYFCFITLSTIGFGDMVPGKSFQRTDTRDGQLKLVACCAYLILGLVLIAMSFNLVQEEVLAKCRQAALYLGILKRTERR
ncbi:TWiK family of potassium channels protein 12-like [Bacillus rossius redtenbacheri]|uniref:TWiK family of potassium channels protein 12-like n=1 Tax=Bacillus rossius redtenbacheri TaxID=93214 RepID=UPI002FDE86FD